MRGASLRGPYIRAAVKAEVRRAMRARRPIDFQYLRDETGLSWPRLERAVALATKQLASAPSRIRGVDEGAKPAPGSSQCPTNGGPPGPFAPSTTSKRRERP
jgi:hypothetical protein